MLLVASSGFICKLELMEPSEIFPSNEINAQSSSEYSGNSAVLDAETTLRDIAKTEIRARRIRGVRDYLVETFLEPLREDDDYPKYGFAQYAGRILRQRREKN